MKIAIYKTGHEIADKVADNLNLPNSRIFYANDITDEIIQEYDIHIGYGILRGTEKVFKAAQAEGKPYFNIDRGYLNPEHFGGYYRISLNGTQHTQRKLDKLGDSSRFDALEIRLEPWKDINKGEIILACLPTGYACGFFGVNPAKWWENVGGFVNNVWIAPVVPRPKGINRPLQDDLNHAGIVITLNSAVGWEALRQGIHVISDSNISFIGSNCRTTSIKDLISIQRENRYKMFCAMANLQLTLAEMREGKLWPLMENLLSL